MTFSCPCFSERYASKVFSVLSKIFFLEKKYVNRIIGADLWMYIHTLGDNFGADIFFKKKIEDKWARYLLLIEYSYNILVLLNLFFRCFNQLIKSRFVKFLFGGQLHQHFPIFFSLFACPLFKILSLNSPFSSDSFCFYFFFMIILSFWQAPILLKTHRRMSPTHND